jgi:hypothetical protein
LWAKSILIERDGVLVAGSPDAPIGTNGKLTIHLYGKDQGSKGDGIVCQYDPHCGVPNDRWDLGSTKKFDLPGDVYDYFYKYEPLKYDNGTDNGFLVTRCWVSPTAVRCFCMEKTVRPIPPTAT